MSRVATKFPTAAETAQSVVLQVARDQEHAAQNGEKMFSRFADQIVSQSTGHQAGRSGQTQGQNAAASEAQEVGDESDQRNRNGESSEHQMNSFILEMFAEPGE